MTSEKKAYSKIPGELPTELIVALDFPRADRAMGLVDCLNGLPLTYKVGFELFLAGGPDIVRELVRRKNRVFLDLKFHDIPNTVAKAVRQAAILKVEMFTLHLAGGSAMVKAVAEEMSEIPILRPRILGVSVLTSFDDVRWAEITHAITGHASSVDASVGALVDRAVSWGVDGVVCSALELESIRRNYPSLYTVVPGIRPEGLEMPKGYDPSHTSSNLADDQARVMTPAQARKAGASAVVIGRPITQSPEPRALVEKILKDLSVLPVSA